MNYNEIEACVIRAKAGNQEDLLKLLESFKPFIVKTARQFNIRNHDTYDLLQIGYITLINSISKYRTGSHTFTAYAFNAVKNSFRYAARKNSKCSEDLSLNTKLDAEGEVAAEFIDFIEDEIDIEKDFLDSETLNQLRKAIAALPEDELELVLMVYYNSIPLKTYAEKKGISYYLAQKKRDSILKKLRQ